MHKVSQRRGFVFTDVLLFYKGSLSLRLGVLAVKKLAYPLNISAQLFEPAFDILIAPVNLIDVGNNTLSLGR